MPMLPLESQPISAVENRLSFDRWLTIGAEWLMLEEAGKREALAPLCWPALRKFDQSLAAAIGPALANRISNQRSWIIAPSGDDAMIDFKLRKMMESIDNNQALLCKISCGSNEKMASLATIMLGARAREDNPIRGRNQDAQDLRRFQSLALRATTSVSR